jgi:zinc transporter 1/2/3
MESVSDGPSEFNSIKFKTQSLFIILIIGLLGGLLPLKLRVKGKLLSYGNVFGGGLFLVAGFGNMLPEAVEGFHEVNSPFPIPYILCALGVLLIFFVERVLSTEDTHKHAHNHSSLDRESLEAEDEKRSKNFNNPPKKQMNMYLFGALMSIHSFIEGIALGVEDSQNEVFNILVAILSHKMIDAFTFGVNIAKNPSISNSQFSKLIFLFASVTPAGILIGASILSSAPNNLFSEAITAISAGTFIYISLVEIILPEFEDETETRSERLLKFSLLLLGVGFMIWMSSKHHHSHE